MTLVPKRSPPRIGVPVLVTIFYSGIQGWSPIFWLLAVVSIMGVRGGSGWNCVYELGRCPFGERVGVAGVVGRTFGSHLGRVSLCTDRTNRVRRHIVAHLMARTTGAR